MNNQLPIISQQMLEITDKMKDLSDNLKLVAIENIQNIHTNDHFIFSLTIFTLACFVGYYVVWKVTPALHTPLMSITNAISGIIIIGGIVACIPELFTSSTIFGYVAVFLASINIFGGFIVTERMLEMFKKKKSI